MPRLRHESPDRPTTTTRVYLETVRLLKILAEAQDKLMADYIHELAVRAAKEDMHHVTDVFSQAGVEQAARKNASKV
jgi:hypothetical protein